MNKQTLILITILLALLLIPTAFAVQESLGVFKQGECVDLIQICADCTYVNFTSVMFPNSTNYPLAVEGTQVGVEFSYQFCETDALGNYIVNGHGDIEGVNTIFTYDLDVTSTGNSTPDGMSFMLGTIFLVIFGIACFFLFVSAQMNEPGPKIFFLIASFIFIAASIAMAVNVAQESNVANSISSTLGSILMAIGAIIFVIIAYIMIRQTVAVLDMYKSKRGMSWGGVGTGYKYAGMQSPNSHY